MTYVKARPGESVDELLRRFKRAVENSGILSDLKKYEFYEKPSVKRKRKKIAARKRWLKQRKKIERFGKPSSLNFKWNRDHTKKIPLQSNFKGKKVQKNTTYNTKGKR